MSECLGVTFCLPSWLWYDGLVSGFNLRPSILCGYYRPWAVLLHVQKLTNTRTGLQVESIPPRLLWNFCGDLVRSPVALSLSIKRIFSKNTTTWSCSKISSEFVCTLYVTLDLPNLHYLSAIDFVFELFHGILKTHVKSRGTTLLVTK